MEFLTKVIDWTSNSILEPLLGKWWAEITLLILFVFFCTIAVLMTIFIIKTYKAYKEIRTLKGEITCLKTQCGCYEVERTDLKSKLAAEYNKFTELEADFLAEISAKKLAISEKEALQKKFDIVKEENRVLSSEVEELKLAKKRSDAARKGVATKRKKAQEQCQIQKQEEIVEVSDIEKSHSPKVKV